MEAGKDPRPDQKHGNEKPAYPEVGKSNPSPAPGGAGTGTQNDPASEPAAQPKK